MIVLSQGMRRSGTSVVYDLFQSDGRFACFYEPLNRVAAAGSDAPRSSRDEHVATFRERFLAQHRPDLSQDDLNWGSPRAPHLELEEGWPPHVQELIREIVGSAPDVFVKFTRASHKLPELARIAPGAVFVHLVRDPRALATSHLFRTHPDVKTSIVKKGTFFTMQTGFDRWRAESMVDVLARTRPDLAQFAKDPAYFRTMLLWRELYLKTRDDARRHFPGRQLTLWHDGLCADPAGTLRKLFAQWGLTPRPEAVAWALANVRPAKPWHDPGNRAWDRAVERLGLAPLIDEASRASDALPAPSSP